LVKQHNRWELFLKMAGTWELERAMFLHVVGPTRKRTVVHLVDRILLLVREDSATSAMKTALLMKNAAAVNPHLNG
jgi:hypothetical protein